MSFNIAKTTLVSRQYRGKITANEPDAKAILPELRSVQKANPYQCCPVRFPALLLLLLPLQLFADGKIFPPTALPDNVTIPDQEALIHWSNGVERLVIETRFNGTGTNFAWVIPLPAVPKIEAATPGLFPTLRSHFEPEVRHNIPRYYLGLLALSSMVGLLFSSNRAGRCSLNDYLFCTTFAAAFGFSLDSVVVGLVIFGVIFVGVANVRDGGGKLLTILVVIAVLAIFASLLLPALGVAGGGTASTAVEILERKLVGNYETTVVSSTEPRALQQWLQTNGYAMPPAAEPVIADYVRDGWVFVATKLRRDSVAGLGTPHPLSFQFPAAKPVYPLRLTGVGNGPLRVALYVFGPERAEAPGFKVEHCGKPDYPQLEKGRTGWRKRGLNIRHPTLRAWVNGSPVATKLTATLDPAAMQNDVTLAWTPFAPAKTPVFSHGGAVTVGLNWGFAVALVGIGLGALGVRVRNPRAWFAKPAATAVLFGAIVGVGCYSALPKVSVRLTKFPAIVSISRLEFFHSALIASLPTNQPLQLADVRLHAAEVSRKFTKELENMALGGPIREEDSPGNYILRQTGGEIEFVPFDIGGGEMEARRMTPMPERKR